MARSPAEIQADIALTRRVIESIKRSSTRSCCNDAFPVVNASKKLATMHIQQRFARELARSRECSPATFVLKTCSRPLTFE